MVIREHRGSFLQLFHQRARRRFGRMCLLGLGAALADRMLWKIGSAKRRTAERHCRLSRGTSPVRPKANQYRSVWMPNNSVSIRRARRLELAKSLRRQLRPRRRRVPHLRKRLSALRHLPTKPSLKTGRIANTSIGGPRRLINFPVPRLPLSSRRERALITRIRSEREANSQGAADQLLGGNAPRATTTTSHA